MRFGRTPKSYYPSEYKPCPRRGDGYCYYPNCARPECRAAWRRSQIWRANLGITEMRQRGDVCFFITITEIDKDKPTYSPDAIESFKDLVSKLNGELQHWAQRAGHDLMWWRAFGFKGPDANAPYQLHVHMMVSWLPDPTPCGGDVYNSTRLKEEANKLGLNLHIEKARDPQAVAIYLTQKNLKHLEGIALPPYFQRSRFSNNWPKLNFQKRRAAKRLQRRYNQQAAWLEAYGHSYDSALTLICLLALVRPLLDTQPTTTTNYCELSDTSDIDQLSSQVTLAPAKALEPSSQAGLNTLRIPSQKGIPACDDSCLESRYECQLLCVFRQKTAAVWSKIQYELWWGVMMKLVTSS